MKTFPETIVDGEGIRYSIYLAGCKHRCKGCQNPKSWNPEYGVPFTEKLLQKIISEILSNPILDGITLSGGDPFYNPEELLILAKRLKEETKMNIWCYTGYTYEEITANEDLSKVLPYLDVLVDGPYIIELNDPEIRFRGSKNQRIIKLQK
ncbi:MAG: anaerobic ribonucleoside-triphosphate reductase activating protein [Rikenellaceae bacterium]